MPNLTHVKALRAKYSNFLSPNKLSAGTLHFLDSANSDMFKGNPNQRLQYLNENFWRFQIQNSLQPADKSAIACLESQAKVKAVILFIDITGFSVKCQYWETEMLSGYLDRYYDMVIPHIYEAGGEVEKIIGDGIICIFGEPFLDEDKIYVKADQAAKKIISSLRGSSMEVKIALHEGEIMYYKNKTGLYTEYTMIGKPLTELFRLEGIAENNAINYFSDSTLKYESDSGVDLDDRQKGWWSSLKRNVNDLKGVSFLYYKTKTKM